MTKFEHLQEYLNNNQKTWLVTGVAGFIGSNLLEKLLILNQKVVGLDSLILAINIILIKHFMMFKILPAKT